MTIKFIIADIPVECDSPDDAAVLIQRLANLVGQTPLNDNEQTPEDPESPDYQAFWEALDTEPKSALRALRDADTELDTETLACQMSVESGRIKYAVRSVRSAAPKFSIKPDDVLCSERIKVDGRPKSQYGMSDVAKEALAGM